MVVVVGWAPRRAAHHASRGRGGGAAWTLSLHYHPFPRGPRGSRSARTHTQIQTGRRAGGGGRGEARGERGVTYPEEALEVDPARVERAVEVVYGVLDRIVLRHQIDQPACAALRGAGGMGAARKHFRVHARRAAGGAREGRRGGSQRRGARGQTRRCCLWRRGGRFHMEGGGRARSKRIGADRMESAGRAPAAGRARKKGTRRSAFGL